MVLESIKMKQIDDKIDHVSTSTLDMLPLRGRHRGANPVITPSQNSSESQTTTDGRRECSATRKMQEREASLPERVARSLSARESRRGRRQITALSVPPSSKKSLGGLFYFLMAKINITYRESECGSVCTPLIDSTLNILGKNHGGAEA